ncbi:DUF4031 domain-containing protein [Marinibacterium profundimaris]|uniref:DUF4031 domain-containing protein n=1 Tax=Marinibacterium profundimaris TaxID=1679460 RepID=UPI000B521AF1|nr:DUF4031 domain-containing protein [Marinibacterium profundimaris]
MAVYVDNMHLTEMGRFGPYRMCHMLADTTEELLAMADRIGMDHKWIQKAGTVHEHFDIPTYRRRMAVLYGAIEITMIEAGRIVSARRKAPGNTYAAPVRAGARRAGGGDGSK